MAIIPPQRKSISMVKAQLLNPATTSHFQVSVSFLSNGFYSNKGGSPFANSNATFYYWSFAKAPLVGSNNVPATAR